jgi:hypothetical protein
VTAGVVFCAGMVFCCRMSRVAYARSVVAAHGPATRSLRPPWSGVSASIRRTTPVTCVLRRWPGPGPASRQPSNSRVSRFGDLATRLISGPIGMAHPGDPVGAT